MKNDRWLNIPLGKPRRSFGDIAIRLLLGLVVILWVRPDSLPAWLFVLCLALPVSWMLVFGSNFFYAWQRRSRYLPLVWLIRCIRPGLLVLVLQSESWVSPWIRAGLGHVAP